MRARRLLADWSEVIAGLGLPRLGNRGRAEAAGAVVEEVLDWEDGAPLLDREGLRGVEGGAIALNTAVFDFGVGVPGSVVVALLAVFGRLSTYPPPKGALVWKSSTSLYSYIINSISCKSFQLSARKSTRSSLQARLKSFKMYAMIVLIPLSIFLRRWMTANCNRCIVLSKSLEYVFVNLIALFAMWWSLMSDTSWFIRESDQRFFTDRRLLWTRPNAFPHY